jgi:hypothetical protein
MTRGSVFYVEIWPPGQYSTGVTFLRDTVELMVWFGFSTGEKWPPLAVEYWPGGHISTEKNDPGVILREVVSQM